MCNCLVEMKMAVVGDWRLEKNNRVKGQLFISWFCQVSSSWNWLVTFVVTLLGLETAGCRFFFSKGHLDQCLAIAKAKGRYGSVVLLITPADFREKTDCFNLL